MILNRSFLTLICMISALMMGCAKQSSEMGHSEGNGGDTCGNRIQTIRDDIASWIQQGGANSLKLPEFITVATYSVKMNDRFKATKVSCVQTPIFISGVSKTCRNFVEGGQSRIECNYQRFNETAESDQYVLIHHEYAGLSGFEVNDEGDSNYKISNQLTEFLEPQVLKKLSVKKRVAGRCGFLNIAGVYGGIFTKEQGSGADSKFPVKLEIVEADEPADKNSPCPFFRLYYSRPDLKSGAGGILATGSFDSNTLELRVFNETQDSDGGQVGHRDLNIHAILNGSELSGRMIWWQSRGSVSLNKCVSRRVSPRGSCM